jgi:hypothetical protein
MAASAMTSRIVVDLVLDLVVDLVLDLVLDLNIALCFVEFKRVVNLEEEEEERRRRRLDFQERRLMLHKSVGCVIFCYS